MNHVACSKNKKIKKEENKNCNTQLHLLLFVFKVTTQPQREKPVQVISEHSIQTANPHLGCILRVKRTTVVLWYPQSIGSKTCSHTKFEILNSQPALCIHICGPNGYGGPTKKC